MVNRGKQFEDIIKQCFLKVPNVSVDRLHDQTTGYMGSSNICDFIVYKKPYEWYIECKSVKGASLPFVNITDTQWNGLLEKSKIRGVNAGIMCWFIDKDITVWIPMYQLEFLRKEFNKKSINYQELDAANVITGIKKRVFFEYDMEEFLNRW